MCKPNDKQQPDRRVLLNGRTNGERGSSIDVVIAYRQRFKGFVVEESVPERYASVMGKGIVPMATK